MIFSVVFVVLTEARFVSLVHIYSECLFLVLSAVEFYIMSVLFKHLHKRLFPQHPTFPV